MGKSSTGLSEKVAAFLCYLLGWLTGLLFFIIEKRSNYVRHHAILSIAVFGSITAVLIVLSFTHVNVWLIAGIIFPFVFLLWIILMILAGVGKLYGKKLERAESLQQ